MWVWLILTGLAHEPGLSRVTVTGAELHLEVARVDVANPMRLLEGTVATVGDGDCALTGVDVQPDDNGFVATATLSCPPGASVSVAAGWFDQVPTGHRTVVEVDGATIAWLNAASPRFDTAHRPSSGAVLSGYVGLGVHHILTGFDHLAFLVGLLLVARTARDIAGIVTGFTLAHSVTLSLGALGLVHAPAVIIEPAIAASIVWVGIENLFDPPVLRRFVLAMLLGLVHGLGFAGLLAEIGLPEAHVPLALFAFNGGVELGQFAVIAGCLPVLVLVRRARWWPTRGLPAASLTIALLGAGWLAQRLYAGFA